MVKVISPLFLALGALVIGASSWAQTAPTTGPLAGNPDSFFERAASCATAHRSSMIKMLPPSQIHDESLLMRMVREAELGYIFAGAAYKLGLRQPQADHLLKASTDRQTAMPESAISNLRNDCEVQAKRLLAETNGLERLLLGRLAESRVKKLMKSPPAKPEL